MTELAKPAQALAEAPELKAGGKTTEPLRSRSRRPASRELLRLAGWGLTAASAFYLAYGGHFAPALVIYLFGLVRLSQLASGRAAAYSGLAVGMTVALGHLGFFFTIFSWGAVALWYVFAFWLGLFVLGASACLQRFGNWGFWLLPTLWTGLEYFRSELYYLRFSWLNCGYALALSPASAGLRFLGMYGIGTFVASAAGLAAWMWPKHRLTSTVVLTAAAVAIASAKWPPADTAGPDERLVRITGIQMEAPSEQEVRVRLDAALRARPDTDLFVLSEYTFLAEIPASVKDWCREHRRHLLAGGQDPAAGGAYYNTCFVVGPEGSVLFRQAKCIPIQFFKDGLPATNQALWFSPWGKIGVCICYDLSYRRVTDTLVGLGAEALIVPTMDVADWGDRQHRLHARVAPTRAAEYGLPIYRLASSGISQWVEASGNVAASAPYPGPGAVLEATLRLRGPGHLPFDHWLGPACAGASLLVLGWLLLEKALARLRQRGSPALTA